MEAEHTTPTIARHRRPQPVRRRAISFSLDLRVLEALDKRAAGENRSRVLENLLVGALRIPHPESGQGSITPG
jgi:hypothetical protein